MDRIELQRNFEEMMRRVQAHNRSDFVVRQRDIRNGLINNSYNYHTAHMNHEIQTIQIDSWFLWNSLANLFPEGSNERDYIYNPPDNIEVLLNYMTMGYGNWVGEVCAGLLREVNHETGIHRAILMIYISPHWEFLDGHILETSFSDGDYIHDAIRELFDETEYVLTEYLSEAEMICFVQNHNDAQRLITNYFRPGFVSMNYNDNLARRFSEIDRPEIAIPPPPVDNQHNIAYYYFREMDTHPLEDNIIPYWEQNDDEIQNVRG